MLAGIITGRIFKVRGLVALGLAFLYSLAFSVRSSAQDLMPGNDSLVRLIEAKAIKLTEIGGNPFRIVKGPARFLHNNTYLLCDSAAWDVASNIIDAMGHVQIIQKNTYLVSEYATYLADMDLVQFRGTEVKLYNRKGDQLKTRFLDYNTADSIATFFSGGAMRSSNGDVVEGLEGMYDAAERLFMFNDNVCMYSDSIFVSSTSAEYHSAIDVAMFGENTVAWRGRDTLFSNNVEYNVPKKQLALKADNYLATKNQELWAGWIDYHRETGNAELYQNVQVREHAQSAIIMGDKGIYVRDPMMVYVTDNAVAGMYSEEKTGIDSLTRRPIYKRDTLFIGGDTLKMWQVPMYQVDKGEISSAKARRELADLDPMVEIDRKNREYLAAYRRNKEMAGKPIPPSPSKKKVNNQEDTPSFDEKPSTKDASKKRIPGGIRDSLATGRDSLAIGLDTLAGSRDSLAASRDSLTPKQDSTAVTFMNVFHNVKIFRSDLRGRCDSLIYTTIDSIARFYKDPVLWNEEKNQFTADSIQLSVRNNEIYKANLIENAFIISQEDSIHYHQIKSTEMVAYFKDNNVYRFDALGGVQAMIFLREKDSCVTLLNQKECRLLTAKIVDRNIERVRYMENVKSDVHPTYGLAEDKIHLRDFRWRADEMPKTRHSLTSRKVIPTGRKTMERKVFPRYYQTRTFFPESYETIMALSYSISGKIREEDRAEKEKERRKKAELEKEEIGQVQEEPVVHKDENVEPEVRRAEDARERARLRRTGGENGDPRVRRTEDERERARLRRTGGENGDPRIRRGENGNPRVRRAEDARERAPKDVKEK